MAVVKKEMPVWLREKLIAARVPSTHWQRSITVTKGYEYLEIDFIRPAGLGTCAFDGTYFVCDGADEMFSDVFTVFVKSCTNLTAVPSRHLFLTGREFVDGLYDPEMRDVLNQVDHLYVDSLLIGQYTMEQVYGIAGTVALMNYLSFRKRRSLYTHLFLPVGRKTSMESLTDAGIAPVFKSFWSKWLKVLPRE